MKKPHANASALLLDIVNAMPCGGKFDLPKGVRLLDAGNGKYRVTASMNSYSVESEAHTSFAQALLSFLTAWAKEVPGMAWPNEEAEPSLLDEQLQAAVQMHSKYRLNDGDAIDLSRYHDDNGKETGLYQMVSMASDPTGLTESDRCPQILSRPQPTIEACVAEYMNALRKVFPLG